MRYKLAPKKQPKSGRACKRPSKRTPNHHKNRCYCSTINLCKSRQFNYDGSLFKIDGLSNVSLMGNDSPSEIHTSKILLYGLGPKCRKMLQDAPIKLDYPLHIVQAIHDYTLTGVCKFDLINLRGLLMAAKEFNIIGIRAQGGHYLVASTHTDNVHDLYHLSLELLCPHTSHKTKDFILEKFEELGQKDDFLQNCKPTWMRDFIKDENLNASENNVFNILVKWASYGLENEQALVNQISKDIRFELMDLNFFNAVVKTCPFLQNNSLVQSAERSIQNRKRKGIKLRQRKMDRPRVPNELVFAVGSYANIEVFDIRANQ